MAMQQAAIEDILAETEDQRQLRILNTEAGMFESFTMRDEDGFRSQYKGICLTNHGQNLGVEQNKLNKLEKMMKNYIEDDGLSSHPLGDDYIRACNDKKKHIENL